MIARTEGVSSFRQSAIECNLTRVKKHLYNSKLSKVKWFVDRFGWREVALKPLRNIFAPVIIPTLPKKTFKYKGEDLPYVYHRYNMTWDSERCVEVPIGRIAPKRSEEHTSELQSP